MGIDLYPNARTLLDIPIIIFEKNLRVSYISAFSVTIAPCAKLRTASALANIGLLITKITAMIAAATISSREAKARMNLYKVRIGH